MKKVITILLVSFFALTGCDSISKLAQQGMEKAKVEANKYVDKQAGSGTMDDYNSMKDDKDKVSKCLSYVSNLNKMCDEQKITIEERDARKQKVNEYYDEFKAGNLTEAEFKSKCDELVKA